MLQNRNASFDSLRGLMALMVVVTHTELIRFYLGLSKSYFNPVILQLGRIGVTGFFVLSGFLITIHLLKLKDAHSFSLPRKFGIFFLKRALRIMPLYYFLIIISIYVLPHLDFLSFSINPGIFKSQGITDARQVFDEVKWYYFFMLPQIPLCNRVVLPFAEPSWSIGVEEMFYIIIPFFVFYTKFKKKGLIMAALAFVILKLYQFYFMNSNPDFLYNFLGFSRFECLLIGCIAGKMYYDKDKLLSFIKKKHFYLALTLLLLFCCFTKMNMLLYVHFALVFAIMIVYIAKKQDTFLNNKILASLGKISYSVYMTHEIAIVYIMNNESLYAVVSGNAFFLYLVVLFFVIAFAGIIYTIVEKPFLIIKEKMDSKHIRHLKLYL
jgi:peptidoglycan/LPS O-acetylase OafA/YrhL